MRGTAADVGQDAQAISERATARRRRDEWADRAVVVAIVAVGVTITVAVVSGFRRMADRIDELDRRLCDRIDAFEQRLGARIDIRGQRLSERISRGRAAPRPVTDKDAA